MNLAANLLSGAMDLRMEMRSLRQSLCEENRSWLSEDDLMNVVDCFQSISKARRDQSPSQIHGSYASFVSNAKSFATVFDQKMKETQDSSLQLLESLQIRRDLYDLCFLEAISAANQHSSTLGGALMLLRRANGDVFASTISLFQSVAAQYETNLREIKQSLEDSEAESLRLFDLVKEVDSFVQMMDVPQETIAKQSKVTLSAGKSGVRPPQVFGSSTRDAQRSYPYNQSPPSPHSYFGMDDGGPQTLQVETPMIEAPARLKSGKSTQAMQANSVAHVHQNQDQQDSPTQKPHQDQQHSKDMSMKQLKDFIQDVYDSKEKSDQKCRDSGLPYETLRQHINSVLIQRYGLKPLVQEWTQVIFHAVERYVDEDNDISVFSKILQGQLDEDFHHVQSKLKETVKELIKMAIRSKYPSRSEADIQELYSRRLVGTLAEEECFEITKYLYNESDASIIWRVCTTHIEHYQQQGLARRLPFANYLRILLDFQLQSRERFLEPLLEHYRQYDAANEGFISEQVFRVLVKRMISNKTDREINAMIKAHVHGSVRQLTLTQCVRALASDLEKIVRSPTAAKIATRSHRTGDSAR